MVLTASRMLSLGSELPFFALPDTRGQQVRASDFQGRPLLVAFICNHCPYVKHIKRELALLGRDLERRAVFMVAISSNDVSYRAEDSPAEMAADVERFGYTFPYLFDEDQSVAKAFDAACTPEFFLFDSKHQLVYRGQLDDSRPGNDVPVTGGDLRRAVDAMLLGQGPIDPQKPSIGCNIKWKKGNAPQWWPEP